MSSTLKKSYDELQKKRKKIKRNAIIFALFLFGVNSYAWFVFIANANMNISANVVSWEVNFYDEALEEMNTTIQLSDLYPGMKPYTKKIVILNSNQFKARFKYEIPKVTLFGTEYNFSSTDKDQIEVKRALLEDFPFSIKFIKSKDVMEGDGDRIEFTIQVEWPFESKDPYHKVTSEFIYDNSTTYYQLKDGVYIPNTTINEDNFFSFILTGIYVESDAADSFWGEQGSLFKKNNPTLSCLKFLLDLKVTQEQENP